MRKYIFLLLIYTFVIPHSALADNIIPVANTVNTAVVQDYSQTYKTSCENLLYLLLSALNEHNYSIEEIQFKTGSVLFKVYTKEFIASVASKDGLNSFIKIIPADNNYNFSPALLQKLYTYLESNTSNNFKKIL